MPPIDGYQQTGRKGMFLESNACAGYEQVRGVGRSNIALESDSTTPSAGGWLAGGRASGLPIRLASLGRLVLLP